MLVHSALRLQAIALAAVQAQRRMYKHAHVGRAIHRHATQLETQGLAAASGARIEPADVQLRALQAGRLRCR
jgi:hypothetical protein